ncbi:alpha-tocopherol transfer protein [Drosophila guanche]|uniref:Blast:Alpha-tocopherol transfer protein-like n=1 Tax=Drosophila guanche TaxID=7266 RepID=A0A3B0IZV2_DROGU|nr:alpha-tocopherol transfer protein [Drosophila guanche]SPP74024.1 blast:Alpha-tocopherol transfer protein-like [Drosophila guanche]
MAELRPLTAELRNIAETELNEVTERLPADLDALREWLAKQPHLKARQDAQFLVGFLRGCKFSLEKTKSKLEHFYTIKTLMPELFANRVVDAKTLALCRTGTCVRLPNAWGPAGPRIVITNYEKFDPKVFKLLDLFRYQTMLSEQSIWEDDHANVSGNIEIIDMGKLSMSFLAQLDFNLIKRMGVFAEKAQPTRIKGIHLINCPKEAVALLNLAKGLMPSKLQQRFNVYKNLEQLSKVIPLEYLPEEYGGSNGRIADIQAEAERLLLNYSDYFKEDSQYGVNEQLRPGKQVNVESIFGAEGSFRKLDID